MFNRLARIARAEIGLADNSKIRAVAAVAVAFHDNSKLAATKDAGVFMNPRTANTAPDEFKMPVELRRNLMVAAIQAAPMEGSAKAFKRSDAYAVVAVANILAQKFFDILELHGALHDANGNPRKAADRVNDVRDYLKSAFGSFQGLDAAMKNDGAKVEKSEEDKAREAVLNLLIGIGKQADETVLNHILSYAQAVKDKAAQPELSAKITADIRAMYAPKAPVAAAPAEDDEAEAAVAVAVDVAKSRRSALAGFAEAKEAARAA
jgi:hypothetical protein